MEFVEPKVFLIAESKVDYGQLKEMLSEVGGDTALQWFAKTKEASKSEGELLTEVSGRICYKSFGLGLNPNVTKIRQNSQDYIDNTLSKGDGSIFEHASCTFAFLNVSRVFCYSADTEVLTNEGWRRFDAIDGSEDFATLNPQRFSIEYLPATNYVVKDYDGEMVRIRSTIVDLLITPNHRIFFFDHDKRSKSTRIWKMQEATLLTGRRFKLKTDGLWEAPDIPNMVIDAQVIAAVRTDTGTRYERKYESLVLPFDSYVSFLGYYGAEGNLAHAAGSSYHIVISQNRDSPHYNSIINAITRIGFDPTIYHVSPATKEDSIRIYNYQLYQHLKKFGNQALDKRVPTEVKNASANQIRLYLDAYTKGDGNIHKKNHHQVIYTSSKGMADDLQELVLKAGLSASIRVDDRVGEKHYNEKCGGWVGQTAPNFVVSFRQKTSLQPMVNQRKKAQRNQVKFEHYSGRVYCVSVPPNELLYVRRNGKPVWCGNTHELVRHRTGVAISQESLRYVRPTSLKFWLPPDLQSKSNEIKSIVEDIEKDYRRLESSFEWDKLNFDVKKRITSALRRVLPDGLATSIIWTANHRTIRHVITMRTAEGAEVEIRYVFDKVARMMKEKFPLIYADFEYKELDDKTRSWKPKYVKA